MIELLGYQPGLNMNQVSRALGLDIRVTDHHLGRLVEEGLLLKLDSALDKEHLYFLPEDREYWVDERTRILYGRGGTRVVGMFVAEHPGCTVWEVSEAVGTKRSAISVHLRRLRDYDLISMGQVGRRVEYHPLKPLRDWMDALGNRYPVPWRDEERG